MTSRLFSGAQIDFEAVARGEPFAFDLRDIIVPLSRMPRYLGHTDRPISVLEHCTLVAELSLELGREMGQPPDAAARAALLHDAAEAFVGDLPVSLRAFIRSRWTGYDDLEHTLLDRIFAQFGIDPSPVFPVWSEADRLARVIEIDALTTWSQWTMSSPLRRLDGHGRWRQISERTPSEVTVRQCWLDLAVHVELINRTTADELAAIEALTCSQRC